MRIISKFKDYYDSASSFGVDLETVYLRESEILNIVYTKGNTEEEKYPRIPSIPSLDINSKLDSIQYLSLEPIILGFCGKIFPIINLNIKYKDEINLSKIFFYEKDKFLDFANKNEIKLNKKSFKFDDNYFNLKSIEDINLFFDTKFSSLEKVFHSKKTPLFLYKNQLLEINPSLKDIDFQKVKDPHTCYQEIFMFLSGVLGKNDKPIQIIEDKYKILQRGFNKLSFRKEKENK